MARRTPVLRRRFIPLIAVVALGLAGCFPSGGSAPPPTQNAMANLVNAHRANVGAPPLHVCGSLNRAAQNLSGYQAAAGTMFHSGNLGAAANNAGYWGWNALGENVAYGYPGVTEVVNGWLGSPGHRANMLSSTYHHIGVGIAYSGATPYWTLEFGRGGTC